MMPGVAADARWSRVDSANFVVIGAAGEPRLRVIAAQFEGFRDVLTRMMSSNVTSTAVPIVVITFPDEKSFRPFKPIYHGKAVDVGGLFLPRRDVNYILLGPDATSETLRPVFHEYTHLIVNNVAPGLPPWLNEGLAEYYSTFELGNDGRTVTFGRLIESHFRELAEQPWIPLNELLATRPDSPHYNEESRRGVFYAESWLLVHMLLNGQPDRRPAFSAYMRELSTGAAPDVAWQHQFGSDDIYKAARLYAGRRVAESVRRRRHQKGGVFICGPPRHAAPPVPPPGSDCGGARRCRSVDPARSGGDHRGGPERGTATGSGCGTVRSRARAAARLAAGHRRKSARKAGSAAAVGSVRCARRLARRLHDWRNAAGAFRRDRSRVARCRPCRARSGRRRQAAAAECLRPLCDGGGQGRCGAQERSRGIDESARGGAGAGRLYADAGVCAHTHRRFRRCAIRARRRPRAPSHGRRTRPGGQGYGAGRLGGGSR